MTDLASKLRPNLDHIKFSTIKTVVTRNYGFQNVRAVPFAGMVRVEIIIQIT